MLVFAGITPHPPILIPTIGKGNLKKIKKTAQALKQMEADLYAAQPEVILLISPHGSHFNDAFTINCCPKFHMDMREFGDLATKQEFNGDIEMCYRLRTATKKEQLPAVMISEPIIDHGSAVPLYCLAGNMPQVKIIILGFSDLPRKEHLNFGKLIQEEISRTNKRVAVIASGDLSHALSTDAPAGFNPDGQEFDNRLRELFMSKNLSGLTRLDEKLTDNAAECGYRSFLILAGILQKTNYDYHELSYEAPFGVGYLTAEFTL